MLVEKGTVQTLDGKEITLQANAVCVHGDNDKSVEIIGRLRKALG